MAQFTVIVEEILVVEASSAEEAFDIVSDNWQPGVISVDEENTYLEDETIVVRDYDTAEILFPLDKDGEDDNE